jgi:hypothetical protein
MNSRRFIQSPRPRADAGDVAARLIEARNKAGLHRIGADREDDRYPRRRGLRRARGRHGVERDDDRHPALD